jgi:hypothetical protein
MGTRTLGFVSAVIAIGAIGLGSVGPAGAVDDTKPDCKLLFSDAPGDNANMLVPAPFTSAATDALGGFIKYDAAKGGATFNIVVKDLAATVPAGYTTVAWVGNYTGPDGTARWVRAVADFTGGVTFERGQTIDAVATTLSLYEGTTPGKMFEGPNGVVQVAIPDLKEGDALNPVYVNILQGQLTLPPQTQAPTRGTSWIMDVAPDGGEASAVKTVVGPCAGGASAPAAAGGTKTPSTGTAPPTGNRKLPVKLVTTSAKAKKKASTLALKLSSSEAIKGIGAQLRKGKSVLGKGSLASLSGSGTIKLKVKALKKGSYTLDLVGKDSAGTTLMAAYKLKVK